MGQVKLRKEVNHFMLMCWSKSNKWMNNFKDQHYLSSCLGCFNLSVVMTYHLSQSQVAMLFWFSKLNHQRSNLSLLLFYSKGFCGLWQLCCIFFVFYCQRHIAFPSFNVETWQTHLELFFLRGTWVEINVLTSKRRRLFELWLTDHVLRNLICDDCCNPCFTRATGGHSLSQLFRLLTRQLVSPVELEARYD